MSDGTVRLGDVVANLLSQEAAAECTPAGGLGLLEILGGLGRLWRRTLYEEVAEDPGALGTLRRRGLRPMGAIPTGELEEVTVEEITMADESESADELRLGEGIIEEVVLPRAIDFVEQPAWNRRDETARWRGLVL